MRICWKSCSGASIAAMQKRHAFSFLFYTLLTITPAYARTAPAAAPANTTTRRQGSAESNVYPLQEGFVDAHGVMIYYKILGRGEPLMIVHGGPGASHDYFLPYLLPLARRQTHLHRRARLGPLPKTRGPCRIHHRKYGGRRGIRPPGARLRQNQSSRPFLRRRAGASIRTEISEQSVASNFGQHVVEHESNERSFRPHEAEYDARAARSYR